VILQVERKVVMIQADCHQKLAANIA